VARSRINVYFWENFHHLMIKKCDSYIGFLWKKMLKALDFEEEN